MCAYWIARFRACEIISPGEYVNQFGPHPEEHRVAMRLEGWPLARPRMLPSFETRPSGAPQDEGLHFFTRSKAGDPVPPPSICCGALDSPLSRGMTARSLWAEYRFQFTESALA